MNIKRLFLGAIGLAGLFLYALTTNILNNFVVSIMRDMQNNNTFNYATLIVAVAMVILNIVNLTIVIALLVRILRLFYNEISKLFERS